MAAEHAEKGNREAANQHSAKAFDHAVKAYAASKHAHEKSHHTTHAT
jgi:hypothetical protein